MMLYFRHILILLVSLYTVRIVLDTLGVEDYGIYNVVAGIVTFFSFLSGTMASATQRFFSFALGQGDEEKLKKTFSVNLIIYAAIALIAVLLLETVGLWFVNEQLEVPASKFESAKILYQFSLMTFVATIITTPFRAIIIAHEDMQIYAYVSILEAVMKLGVVFLLLYLPGNKLQLYGALILGVSIINAVTYMGISSYKYAECQYKRFYWDRGLFHEIVGFTGWTLFGQITTVGRNQAVTILLNQVFNPVVVAARAIAMNISSQIMVFSSNFNIGLYPPIIKSYAANDKKHMFSLISNGSKITFFLMWVFALPFFLEMETILNIWLKNPPIEAVLFTRLALVEVLINSISMPIATAARAPGRMKVYELTLGIIQIGIFVASWIALKFGGAPYSVFVVAIVANIVMFMVRLLIVRSLIGLSLRPFFREVVYPLLLMVLISTLPSFAIYYYLPEGFVYTIISILLSVIITTTSMYYIGLDKAYRNKVRSVVGNRIKKIF